MAIVISAICVPVLLFFKNKPLTPPSSSAESNRDNFYKSFCILMKNKNFAVMVAGFGLIFGNFNTGNIKLIYLLAGTLIN